MTNKTVPLSVRVSDDDAAFLARLELPDTKTPSEKLRAILALERRRHEGTQDPNAAIDLVEDMVRAAERRVRRLEGDGPHSDLVHKAYRRVPELAGLLMAGPTGNDEARGLAEFEARIAAKLAGLVRDFLELGLSSQDRCYQIGAIDQHLPPVIGLVELLKHSVEQGRESK